MHAVSAILSAEQCFDKIKSVDSEKFAQKTLACQKAGETNEKCCNEVQFARTVGNQPSFKLSLMDILLICIIN